MQEMLWLLTLALVAALALIFLSVIWRASASSNANASHTAGRFRQPLFWVLVVVGIAVTYGTLNPWPHAPDPQATGTPMRVHATAEQWSWEVDRTQLPLNKPIMFVVTSRDVNHGFGIYDADLKLLSQVQAMPGYINRLYYTFTKPGKYRVLCLEYCGLIHHDMTAELTVTP